MGTFKELFNFFNIQQKNKSGNLQNPAFKIFLTPASQAEKTIRSYSDLMKSLEEGKVKTREKK